MINIKIIYIIIYIISYNKASFILKTFMSSLQNCKNAKLPKNCEQALFLKIMAKKLAQFRKNSYLCNIVAKVTSGNEICGITMQKIFDLYG